MPHEPLQGAIAFLKKRREAPQLAIGPGGFMSSNQPRIFSSRALRVLVCVLALGVSNACTHNSSSGYREAPPFFPGVQLIPTKAGGFSVRVLSGMLPPGPPLYVVDGVRMSVDPVRGIDWLQQGDILSIRLLKDPSEVSVYGQSGNNGVVLITTRQSLKQIK
jgi:TonB-dependent SusC/RagA subfamily outer membrane receptor